MSGNRVTQFQKPAIAIQTGTYGDGRPIMTFVQDPGAQVPAVSVADYGAVADGLWDQNGAITSGQTALTTTSSPGPFQPWHTGRFVLVRGAGASGSDLWAQVTYVSAQALTLSVAASTTVSGASIYLVQTNDLPALQSAMQAAVLQGGAEVTLGAGVYLVDISTASTGALVSQGAVRVRGAGRDATILVCAGTPSAGTVVLFSAAPGTTLQVEDMTIIAPPNPAGFSNRGIWHQGAGGRLIVSRVNAWNWSACIEGATGAGVEMILDDIDVMASPVLNLGGACVVANDILRISAYRFYVRQFGFATSNQNHGFYIHQGVDADLAHGRFGANLGTGFGIQFFNGSGTSPNCSVDDCYFGANSFIGILTNATVKTRISNCRFACAHQGIYVNGDIDLSDCQFDGVASGQQCIIQLGATPASHLDIKDCYFNTPAATGTTPLVSNIAGNVWRVQGCRFTCNQSVAISNSGGGTYALEGCSFADDGINHHVSAGGAAPTLGSVNANVTAQAVAAGANDIRGVISFNTQTATIPAGTALFTVTFATPYGVAPIVLLINQSNVTTGTYYAAAVGASSFQVFATATLAVATGFKVAYLIQG